jgi:multiple sugar transport system substrate-binding protein
MRYLWCAIPLAAAVLASCGRTGAAAFEIWAHAGQAGERRVLEGHVEEFMARHPGLAVELTLIPEGSYHGQVQAATAAGDLPDVLELDGPYVALSAWHGVLRPLDRLLSAEVLAGLLPSVIAQGSFQGSLWAVGAFDSGLGLFARRGRLEAIGARVPDRPDAAWTAAEFEAILHRLAGRDDDGAVLDLKLDYADEWFSYGFSPVLQSAGADLIDRETLRAEGTLDGRAAVSAMEMIRSWIAGGLVDPNLDDAAFTSGRVAVSWVGHWEFERYASAVGDDLVLVPLPDFGRGTRTGQGSWCWAVTRAGRRPETAAAFLELVLEDDRILEMTGVNGAVPATRSAVRRAPRFAPGGPLELYVIQLDGGWSVPRPRTPAYPAISTAFSQAFRDIRDGADAASALERAAHRIDAEVADNRGYPFPPTGGQR